MIDSHKLKCPECDSILHLSLAFDGCDWNSIKGEGSNFDHEISLRCPKDGCGYIYSIGRIKNDYDFVENLEKYRPYAGKLNDC